MATFMLVHGGGCGSWIWRWTTPLLRERGHDVYTTTMTGTGDRRHLLTKDVTIETNVADVANAIEFEDLTDCTVVAHSQSGTVMPGLSLAMPERIQRIVFLDSVLLRTGEAIAATMGYLSEDACRELVAKVRRGEAPPALDMSGQQQGEAQAMSDSHRERAEWMLSRLTPIPAVVLANPIEVGVEQVTVPAVYIACEETAMTHYQSVAKDLGWPVRTVAADHALMVSNPELTASVLDEVATGLT
jgi:pimeloyl-ACP methyl ester carboxylesterase